MQKRKQRGYWENIDNIHTEALLYNTKADFAKSCRGGYNSARKLGVLDDVCSHMNGYRKSGYWTINAITEEALKYTSRMDFYNAQGGAYSRASVNGWLDVVCSHMSDKRNSKEKCYWTKERVINEALKYSSKKEFSKYSGGARNAIDINGWDIDAICSHMDVGKNGFNAHLPAIMYYLKINSGSAYKIGITNRTVEERFLASELKNIEIIKIWNYETGKQARVRELSILNEFKYAKYKGEEILDTGNTELFDRDILGLDC